MLQFTRHTAKDLLWYLYALLYIYLILGTRYPEDTRGSKADIIKMLQYF